MTREFFYLGDLFMNFKNKFFTLSNIAIIIALIFSLSGCGGSSHTDTIPESGRIVLGNEQFDEYS